MKIFITYTEIPEKEDEVFKPKKEEILLESIIPYNHFRERYEYRLVKPKPKIGTKKWEKVFIHCPKVKPFRLIKEVAGFLANAVSRFN